MWCGACGEAMDEDERCIECTKCVDCCDCGDVVEDAGTFDADEFGEEPEDEFERRTRGQFIR